jgi:ribosomal protein S18 acetylase RimI-like enzyme
MHNININLKIINKNCKEKDIKILSNLIIDIIKNTSYYNQLAKNEESKNYSPKNLYQKLLDPQWKIIAMYYEKKIIGFLSGYIDGETLFWIDWLGVKYNYRNKKLAHHLIHYLEKQLLKLNIHKIWCDSRTNNHKSNNLLRKHKFKKRAKFEKHWYNQNFFIWEKFINPPIHQTQ